MRRPLLLAAPLSSLFGACAAPLPAAPVSRSPLEGPAGVCEDAPDPDRDLGLGAIIGRLDTQGCLDEADLSVLQAELERQYAETDLFCHSVYRISADGEAHFEGEPERVREHASVPDVLVLADGSHLLVYNDVTPGRLVSLVREDPARLWRQGLLGLGGLGLSLDRRDGAGFQELDNLDLALPHLQEAVDPDLGLDAEGDLRLTWLGREPDQLAALEAEPGATLPHHFWMARGPELEDLRAVLAVASQADGRGGTDPTVYGLPTGGEAMLAGPTDARLVGWTRAAGDWPAGLADPDFTVPINGVAPDVVEEPDGSLSLYYMDGGHHGRFFRADSADGLTWTVDPDPVMERTDGTNAAFAEDPDGTRWVYFNAPDPDCDLDD